MGKSLGEGNMVTKPVTAATAVTQYYLVKIASGKALHNTANTDVFGVAQEACTAADATAGKVIQICTAGPCKAVAGAAITEGALIYAGTAGKLAASGGAGVLCLGRATEAATADGDVIGIVLDFAIDNA